MFNYYSTAKANFGQEFDGSFRASDKKINLFDKKILLLTRGAMIIISTVAQIALKYGHLCALQK